MIVLANGCFDPFHIGHLKHLQAAKKLGELLYVSVTADAYVNKGPGRPFFPQEERLEMIKALEIVHSAFIVSSCWEALVLVRPDIYVKGSEYEGSLQEQEFCEAQGIKVVFTHEKTYSSTKILRFYHDRPECVQGL